MMIERVVRNLIENAIKYADPARPSAPIEVSVKGEGARGRVEVRDQGIGIAAADLPHLFEPFYRVDKSRAHAEVNGFGLGLSICKAIVEAHGGQIDATSTVGRGSVFTFVVG